MWLRQEQNVLLSFVNVCVCSVTQLCLTLGTARTITFQAPRSMGFSRQEYWNGLPFPPSRDFPHPGIEPTSPASQADSLLLNYQESPNDTIYLRSLLPAAWGRTNSFIQVLLFFCSCCRQMLQSLENREFHIKHKLEESFPLF